MSGASPRNYVPDSVWQFLETAIAAFNQGDIHKFVSAGKIDAYRDPIHREITYWALFCLCFLVTSRRIDHRPLSLADADQVFDELAPRLHPLGLRMTDDELRSAIRMGMNLSPPAGFEFQGVSEPKKLPALWMAIIGARIEDIQEFTNLRPAVSQYLRKRDYPPLD